MLIFEKCKKGLNTNRNIDSHPGDEPFLMVIL